MTESKNHYVDNEKFLNELLEYKKVLKEKPDEIIPEYIADCFLKIAQNLAHRPNFSNYTFKDDMIFDGVENCLQYVNNFDPEKSKNPFSYFTQIIFYAFLRKIEKEKKQLYVKYKMIDAFEENEHNMVSSDEILSIKKNVDYEFNMQEFISNFEKRMNKKREKKNKLFSNQPKEEKDILKLFV